MNRLERFSHPAEVSPRDKMTGLLISKGIAPEAFVALDHRQRLEILIEAFGLEGYFPPDPPSDLKEKISEGVGLVVVKPEIYHVFSQAEDFIGESLGLDILQSKEFVYSPSQYWSIYGGTLTKHFEDFPYGAPLFLISITLPSRLVLFRHKNIADYEELFKRINDGLELPSVEVSSRQHFFDKFFVKSHTFKSLRSFVYTPEVLMSGMLPMDSNLEPIGDWDFTGSFSERGFEKNFRTFNGVHSPGNELDLLHDLSVLW